MPARFSIAFVLLAAFGTVRPVVAQRTNSLTIGIRPASHPAEARAGVLHSRASDDAPDAGPYVLIGAIVGAAVAGLWEARAVSQSGGDFVGTGGLLWIPPVAGAVLGACGGWLVFKIAHSGPAT
jgi:hypothetical protein